MSGVRVLVGTRKGLFELTPEGHGWCIADVHFLGEPVSAVLADGDRLYRYFTERLRASGLKVATGRFQSHMKVALVNDGPVTFVLEN